MFDSWKALFIFCELLSSILASTHWVVTENGRIQAQEDSPFNLRRPYDLLALLEQERRVREVDKLYRELAQRKAAIDLQWAGLEGAGDLEARLNAHDEDCLHAGRQLSDHDLYSNAPSGDADPLLSLEEFLPEDIPEDCDEQPDCRNVIELDFSMQTFEHLAGMVRRGNLSLTANAELAALLLGRSMSLEQFGRQVAAALRENATSWVHYNLASVYWQMAGHAPNAMDCARRAVHFAPRDYRGAALLNMGSIFHLAHKPREAAIILHAAVDHHPLRAESHFVLGNVYAVLGDTNRSVACYENAVRLRPDWEHVSRAKHILLCHRKLEQGLLQLHGSLQGILAELHGYHSQQEQWLRLQERLMREKAPPDHTTLSAMLGSRVQSCRQKVQDGHSVLSCDLGRDSQRLALGLQMDITHSLQVLLRNVESQAKEISKQLSSALEHLQDGTPLPPNSSRLKGVGVELPDTPWGKGTPAEQSPAPPPVLLESDEEWPFRRECADLAGNFPDLGNFPSVYLPPENKGFQVRLYLGELLGLPFGAVHKLPWSPPLCGRPQLPAPRNPEHPAEPHLRAHLLKYVNEGRNEDTEIGQRILTAINKEVGPGWMLQTLASLYWRARGNPHHAIGCLEAALSSVPGEYRDVPLVSLGSLLARLGRLDEAATLVQEALSVSSLEPATHFLMASVLSSWGNFSGAAHHLRQVLRLDPNYISDGVVARLLLAVSCRLRFGGQGPPSFDDTDLEGMCGAPPVPSSQSSVATSSKYINILAGIENLKEGETLICSPDGEQCRAVQCFSTNHDTGRASIMTLEPDAVSCLLTHGLYHCRGRHGLPKVPRVGTDDQDETELERMTDEVDLPKFHMRISFSEEGSLRPVTQLGDLIVPVTLSDDPMPESWLRKDKETNTYPLSPGECERIRAVDWEELAAIGYRTAMRDINVELPSAHAGEPEPLCQLWVPPSPLTLDHLDSVRARHRLRLEAEEGAAACLGAITGLQGSSARELGTRIAAALQENATSWVLATAAALYWRAVGNTNHAISCLRQALQYVPSADRDIPLISLANLLHRAGFYSDALVVANMALDLAPKSEITHFTVANIHTSLGDLEKAIAYHRTSLLLQPRFEPARSRLQSILCSLVFEDHAVKTGP